MPVSSGKPIHRTQINSLSWFCRFHPKLDDLYMFLWSRQEKQNSGVHSSIWRSLQNQLRSLQNRFNRLLLDDFSKIAFYSSEVQIGWPIFFFQSSQWEGTQWWSQLFILTWYQNWLSNLWWEIVLAQPLVRGREHLMRQSRKPNIWELQGAIGV